ncbi:cell division protein FtsB [Nitrobacteraceae bacterium AZCC 2146]
MKFKWAALDVLAKWPDRRVTFAEIRREVGQILETGNRAEQARFSELGDIDLLQAGLVSIDDVGLQITDAGLSLLRSLESSAARPPTASSSSASYQFELLNNRIGTQDRSKIFDREMRRLELLVSEQEEEPVQTAARNANMDDRVVERPQEIDDRFSAANEHVDPLASKKIKQTDAMESIVPSPQDAPAFMQPSFAAKARNSDRKPPDWLAGFFATTANKARYLAGLWRGHVVHDTSNRKAERGNVGGAVLAFLSLVAVLACAAAAIALVQIKSLKTDIATLHRELGPLKERFAKLEQAEKAKLVADQNATAEKTKAAAEPRPDQTGLFLSREEIQLIRDVIKATPP